MIYERLPYEVDVDRLREFFQTHVAPLPPVMQSLAWGGWSATSRDGSYKDGWHQGHTCYKVIAGKPVFDLELAAKIGYDANSAFTVPTELCSGYVEDVLEMIRSLGLSPMRARWAVLKAGTSSALHRDGWEHEYAVRLHIPVITNPYCTFEVNGESVHFPADGGMYLVKVNRLHQIHNRGEEDRIHLFMNIVDRANVSEHHRYPTPSPTST